MNFLIASLIPLGNISPLQFLVMMKLSRFCFLALTSLWTLAQSGDKPGESQEPLPPTLQIPPAPTLSPQEALKTIQVAPGFRVELVASEPMIEAPVAMDWDPNGRLYVLEMRGFMPNIEGKGEDQPNGRVSLLEDTNGDGRMDKNTIFADGLIMPRALAVVRGGLLVAEPPRLWFLQDSDGDGKSDTKEEVTSDYGNQKNPEHNANGLLWARDNWIYSANHTVRYRYTAADWEKEGTIFRGQWGITQDDYGRLFFNSNSDHIRGDLVPAHYLSRNTNFKTPSGANVQLCKDQQVWPIRVNPGVNRGYQRGQLRQDGTLRTFTAACSPCIYRGDLFPKEFYGAAFVCGPGGNLVRASFLRENNGIITATNALVEREFLASTDERFRPVNIFNGPDGALYIVDMYRGIIQHRMYVTTFLRNQILERGLEKPLDQGRIYRVLPVNAKSAAPPKLTKLPTQELVKELSAPNGWRRDKAQQLLVERRDNAATEPLLALVRTGEFPAAVHALWTLHALGGVDAAAVLAGLRSPHEKVRATAIRVGESFLRAEGKNDVIRAVLAAVSDHSTDVQIQLMFSLGENKSPESEAAMLALLDRRAGHPLIRDAAISGLAGRELLFLERLLALPSWNEKSLGREEVLSDLARCTAESRDPVRLTATLDLAAKQSQPWRQFALLDGVAAMIPPKGRSRTAPAVKSIKLAAEPAALTKLKQSKDPVLQQKLAAIDPLIVWAGKPGYIAAEVKPLSESEQKHFEAGKELYSVVCAACHQPTGLGLDGLAPPLVDSDWVTGSPGRLARIILHGARGPMNVKGKTWELEMPPLFVLDDEQIASLMTYVRREWDHTASPVDPDFVAKVRKETDTREEAWTERELLKLPD